MNLTSHKHNGKKMKSVLMFGQFSPPITGEALVNEKVFSLLKRRGFTAQKLNSSIINDANSVGKFSLLKLVKTFRIYLKFAKLINKNTIVYITPGQTFLGALRILPILFLCRIYRLKVIGHWHGYGLLKLVQDNKFLMSIVLNNIDCNILLTVHLRKKICAITNSVKNAIVITNYVEHSDYIKNANSTISALYLGSLMEEKGIYLFMAAAKTLPNIQFNICGTGAQNIVDLVKNTAAEFENINYHGVVEGVVKHDILAQSDIFVLQSHYLTEGVPLSILEAMASKCAIITTRHNGIPEAVDGAAVFIEKQNLKSLVDALQNFDMAREFLKDYQLKSFKQSSQFSPEAFEEKLLVALGSYMVTSENTTSN
jgi:glycosyltransferase involved in cell wall biosynthesis